jgi:hypothetical protein
MNDEQMRFFTILGRGPAVWSVVEVGWFLKIQPGNVRLLVNAGLLRPLGKPAPNAPKFFSSAEVIALAANREWLSKMNMVISKATKAKNDRRSRPNCRRTWRNVAPEKFSVPASNREQL